MECPRIGNYKRDRTFGAISRTSNVVAPQILELLDGWNFWRGEISEASLCSHKFLDLCTVCPISHPHIRSGRQRCNRCIQGCMKMINILCRSLAQSNRACWMGAMFDSSCHFVQHAAPKCCSLSCTTKYGTLLYLNLRQYEMIKIILIKIIIIKLIQVNMWCTTSRHLSSQVRS